MTCSKKFPKYVMNYTKNVKFLSYKELEKYLNLLAFYEAVLPRKEYERIRRALSRERMSRPEFA